MWCRLCCSDVHGAGFLLRHGPVDFHFCNENHYATWKQFRFHPDAYFILRSMPLDRAALLPAGVSTEEFLSRLDGQCDSNSKAQ